MKFTLVSVSIIFSWLLWRMTGKRIWFHIGLFSLFVVEPIIFIADGHDASFLSFYWWLSICCLLIFGTGMIGQAVGSSRLKKMAGILLFISPFPVAFSYWHDKRIAKDHLNILVTPASKPTLSGDAPASQIPDQTVSKAPQSQMVAPNPFELDQLAETRCNSIRNDADATFCASFQRMQQERSIHGSR